MTIFNGFFQVANQHKRSLFIYLGIFAALCIMFTNTTTQNPNSFTPSEMNIAVIKEETSEAAQGLITYLQQQNNVTFYEAYSVSLADQLYYRLIDYILIIPEGFEQQLQEAKQLEHIVHCYVLPGSAEESYGKMQLDRFIQTYAAFSLAGVAKTELTERTLSSLMQEATVIIANGEEEAVAVKEGDYYFFQYLPYVLLCMLIQALSAILISFWKKDVAQRTNSSGTSVLTTNLWLFFACLTFSAFLLFFFLILKFALYGFGIDLLRLVNTILFFAVSIAFAYLLAVLSVSDNVLSLISNIIGLGQAFISGAFVPEEVMVPSIIRLGKCFPMYWNLQVNHLVSNGITTVTPKIAFCYGFQLLYVVTLLSVALLCAKRQQQK